MAILFSDNSYRSDKIFGLLRDQMPGIDLRHYPDIGKAEEIEYAIAFRPALHSLQNLPNLKAVFMTSAGVDVLMNDATLPDVPIVRNTDPAMANGIRDYVLYHVLHYHRFFDKYLVQQTVKFWKQYPQIDPAARKVGFLGLGEMALPAARALVALGFDVRCWSNSEKHEAGVQSFYGAEQLNAFLADTEIVINLLPLTDATRGILNATLFAQLPKDAILINAGRGDHLNEAELIAALDSGYLRAAVLDAFPEEPLVETSPLWTHPKIKITPHIASLTDIKNAAENILKMIGDFEKGGKLENVVDRRKQY